jgi:tight adherence protein B
VTALVAAVLAGSGVHLLWTSLAMGHRRLRRPMRATDGSRPRTSVTDWLVQAGLDDLRPREFLAATVAIGLLTAVITYGLFASPLPSVVMGVFGASAPAGVLRRRRKLTRERAQEAWPRIIEEIRILTGSVGRSIPQALFEAGRRAPVELRPAFDAAHREWLITTDFARTVAVLKGRLADPTADAACETLLVAHEVGGADLDRRLEALAEDRIHDVQGRRDARAQQAGVRFARKFVLIVPFGMALAGMSVGNGQSAYREPMAQVIVGVAILLVVACWVWAGRIMHIPEEERVFAA